MNINTSTPRESFSIQGAVFNIAQPFVEGHVLNANEAASLNQTLKENVRNNQATIVSKMQADNKSVEEIQAVLDEYTSKYEFGVRTGGGIASRDPIHAEAMNIAKSKVKTAMLKAGMKLKEVSAAQLTAKAAKVLADNPILLEQAKIRVEALNDITIPGLEPKAKTAEVPVNEGDTTQEVPSKDATSSKEKSK